MVKILNYRADIQEINPAFDILQESNNRLEFVNTAYSSRQKKNKRTGCYA